MHVKSLKKLQKDKKITEGKVTNLSSSLIIFAISDVIQQAKIPNLPYRFLRHHDQVSLQILELFMPLTKA